MGKKIKKVVLWLLAIFIGFPIAFIVVFALIAPDAPIENKFDERLEIARENARILAAEKRQKAIDEPRSNESTKVIVNSGLSQSERKQLSGFSTLLELHVSQYVSYTSGSITAASMESSCNRLSKVYPNLDRIKSSSSTYENLLDRSKDYYYESMRSCNSAFKKNRISDLRESAEYASASKGFIDRLIIASK